MSDNHTDKTDDLSLKNRKKKCIKNKKSRKKES